MSLKEWAMDQIKRLGTPEEKAKQYETILDAFCSQGHSGTTANYTLSYVLNYLEVGYEGIVAKLNKTLEGAIKDKDEMAVDMQCEIIKDIMQIINLFREYDFGKEEAHNLVRLMDWKPIMPLTGAEDEWGEVSNWGNKVTQQNKLCSAVFRDNHDNSTAHYLYGRIYSDNGGHSWFTTNRGSLCSSTSVTFPFYVPDKSEKVYLNGEGSEKIITDPARIKELYDRWEERYKGDIQ